MESESLPPSEPYQYFFQLILLNIDQQVILLLVAILVFIALLFMSALISGSEVAFFSINPNQFKQLRESDDQKEKLVVKLLDQPRLLLASILISNNFVNITIILLFNLVMNNILSHLDAKIIALINVAVLTPLLVFFGEVSPKVFANQNNVKLATKSASFFNVVKLLTYPIGIILVKSGLFIEKRFEKHNHEIDLEEIEKAIDLSTTDGSTEEDVSILKGIVHFGNTTVRQIMVPRVDIHAIKKSLSFSEILENVRETGYSRMPVYDESIDKIEGILYLKDLLEHLDESENFMWFNLLREPFFVPETKKIDDLMREMQNNRMHQAIVVDEYGGTKGLVTLEDILEEVVGEIRDEFDNEELEASFKKVNKNTYIFDARISLYDLCEALKVSEDHFASFISESGTLAGVILELLGELPKKGDIVTYNQFKFNVLSMNKNRIDKVKLTIKDA